jgi:hypothetical protein
MPYFDAALMVVEEGKNSPDELRKSLKILEGTNLLGSVMNKATISIMPQY